MHQKKALTPYMLFANKIRNIVKETNPDMKFQDITREIGRRWREATPEDKEEYNIQHKQIKEEYEKKKTEYMLTHPPAEKSTKHLGSSKPRIQKDHTGNDAYVKDPNTQRFFKKTSNKGKTLAGLDGASSAVAVPVQSS